MIKKWLEKRREKKRQNEIDDYIEGLISTYDEESDTYMDFTIQRDNGPIQERDLF